MRKSKITNPVKPKIASHTPIAQDLRDSEVDPMVLQKVEMINLQRQI